MSRLAARQFGRVASWQLRRIGVSRSTVAEWTAASYLHHRLPGVYAVGHDGPSIEADLAEAVLYAGPGAMLSHVSAIWWLGLLDHPPTIHHVSTARRCNSLPGLIVHARRDLERNRHRRLPITTVPQALLDFAIAAPPDRIRFVLANAEYHGLMELEAIERILSRGRAGSSRLRAALERHQPRLARTRSELERALIALCERHGLPLPDVNVHVHGWLVDAVWPESRLVVELDGYQAHRTRAQLRRAHQRDLELRAAAFTVIHYGDDRLKTHADRVAAELRNLLSSPAPSAARGSR